MYGLGDDRRRSQRFPIEMDVRYRSLKKRGTRGLGRSINISSSGVLLSVQTEMFQEQAVEVALNWPVRLNNVVPLQLVIQGGITRTGPGWAAVTIDRFEFRTASVQRVR